MALIKCENLSVGYDKHAVLQGINFEVNKGDYLCVIGENGSGKSTLMRTLLSLQPPVGGQMTFGAGLMKNELGYLPQRTEVQKDFPASVQEIVVSGFQGKHGFSFFYTKEEKETAAQNMERLNITNLKKRCFRELSGGQQQRALLARALCATDKIILLDEPVSGLDPSATEEMYNVIEQLNKEGVTIIMISHDMEAAIRYATHILRVGTKVFFGTKDEYLAFRKEVPYAG